MTAGHSLLRLLEWQRGGEEGGVGEDEGLGGGRASEGSILNFKQ